MSRSKRSGEVWGKICMGKRKSRMTPAAFLGASMAWLVSGVCAVLCVVTRPEHAGLRLSTAVTRCQVVRAQTRDISIVWRHVRQPASLAVIIAWLDGIEEVVGSNPISSTKIGRAQFFVSSA